jgi:hypothetical protein
MLEIEIGYFDTPFGCPLTFFFAAIKVMAKKSFKWSWNQCNKIIGIIRESWSSVSLRVSSIEHLLPNYSFRSYGITEGGNL